MKFMASSSKQSKVPKKKVRSTYQPNDDIPETGIYFKKSELEHYIKLLTTDEKIFKFLEFDGCCRLADNYLLALVFVYFKRAGLSVADYSYTNFFAGLLLAHALVEENETFIDEINHWALPNCASDRALVEQLQTVKFLMFQAMGYKAAVSQDCLQNVMSAVSHSIWSRKRDFVHAGTAFRDGLRHFPNRGSRDAVNMLTASCEKCRRARRKLFSRA